MSGSPRNYRTLEEFEREEIRPSFRIGFSVDDFEESSFEAEVIEEFEIDPADESDDADDDEDEDDDE